jgi:hypothetical protein
VPRVARSGSAFLESAAYGFDSATEAERSTIIGHSDAVRVSADIAQNGAEVVRRPSGEYEHDCRCEISHHRTIDCECDWWYLPDSPTQYRAFLAVERAHASIATVSRALANAEASARSAERALAVLRAQEHTR